MKRILAVLVGLALALIGTVAVAAWLSSGTAVATASATTVDRANAPVAARGSGTVELTWAPSTVASGDAVSGYEVLRHDGSTTTTVCIVTSPGCVDTTPVARAVSYGVVATVGANWKGPESPTTAFTYDDIAPVTTASVDPVPNGAGWNKTSVTVSLAATDNASSVDHIAYKVDSDDQVTVSAATTNFTVSGAGTHTITYFAVDGVGNTEATHSLPINIDPNAPTTAVTPTPAPNSAGWNNTNVMLGFLASDSGSGVKSVTVDGVTTGGASASRLISAEGTTTVPYFATDFADNVEGAKYVSVKIDKTAPTSSIDPSSSTSWTTDNTIALTASDALSGVASIEYRIDGGAIQTYAGTPFTLAEGSHTVDYRATDVAGNVQPFQSAIIKVDTVAPSSTIANTTSNTWTITASDAAPSSGVSIEYWVDSGSHTTVSGTSAVVTVPEGSHTIHWFALDAAGNHETQHDRAVTVATADTTAPTVSMTYPTAISPIINNGQWTNSGCTPGGKPAGLCGTGADNIGVVGSAQYEFRRTDVGPNTCWNGTSFTQAACGSYQTAGGTAASWQIAMAFSSLPNGSFELRVKLNDAAGNSNRPGATPSGTPDLLFTK